MNKTFTINDFLEIKASYEPSFSPDEKKVVYLNNHTGTFQIYLLDLETTEIKQLTNFEDYISLASFSPTQNQLVFKMAKGGNENTQLYLMDLNSNIIEELTNKLAARFNFGGWSKDGKKVVFGSNERNGKDFDVFVMDLETKIPKLVLTKEGWWEPYGFSPQGTFLAVNFVHSLTNHELHLINLVTGKTEKISYQEGEAIYGKPQWLPDESGFYIQTNKEKEFVGVAFFNFQTKKFEYRLTLDWDIEEIKITEDGKFLAVVTNEDGYNISEIFNTENLKPISHSSFPKGFVKDITWNREGSKLAFSFSSSTQNLNVWLWDKNNDEVKKLTKSYNPIPEETFIEPKLIHYKSFDGLEISTFLYLPKNQSKSLPPAVVNIHGGPEGQYQPIFTGLTQYLLYKGYAVVAPNVRGSTGYGKTFTSLDNIQKRMNSIKDLEYLYRYLQEQNLVDISKIALMGGSYGGFMVLAGLYLKPDLWAAGINIVGISNFVTFLKNTAPYRRYLREREYGSLERDSQFLESISPINHVDNIKAPLLIIHGANDPRVPLSEAEQIETRLKNLDRKVQLLVYSDEGHGLAKLKNRLDCYPRVVEFLDKYLKGGNY